MASATKHKTQILLNESQGSQVRENVHKETFCQNLWKFCMASSAEEAQPAAAQTKASANDLLELIRQHIYQAPSLNFLCMVHGLTKRNDMIGLDELVWALQQLELVMNETDYH